MPEKEAAKHGDNERNHQNYSGANNRIKAPDGLFNFIHVSLFYLFVFNLSMRLYTLSMLLPNIEQTALTV